MSKLSGQLFLKNGGSGGESGVSDSGSSFGSVVDADVAGSSALFIRYLKKTDSFEFRVSGIRPSCVSVIEDLKEQGLDAFDVGISSRELTCVSIPRSILEKMIEADSCDEVTCEWSYGYKTKIRKKDWKLVRDEEMKLIGLVSSDEYIDVCVWQYLYCISKSLLVEAMRMWKRRKWEREGAESCWVQVKRRSVVRGRTSVGSRNVVSSSVSSSVSESGDVAERIAHNKKVAVLKRVLGWYIEACKEECKLRGTKFDKRACVKEYNELCS